MQSFSNTISKSAWADRFTEPKPQRVIEAMDESPRAGFEMARRLIFECGLAEEFIWQGVWRWSFVYTPSQTPAKPAAFLIPDPHKPRLCVPIDQRALLRIVNRPMFPLVRRALAECPVIDGVRWPTWTIISAEETAEIVGSLLHLRSNGFLQTNR